MPSYSIRPNGDVARNYVTLSGGTTAWTLLRDNDDDTRAQFYTGGTNPTPSYVTCTIDDLPALAANEVIVQVRASVRFSSGNGTTSTFVRFQNSAGQTTPADYWAVNAAAGQTTYVGQWHRVAPDGGEWTAAKVNALIVDVRDDDRGTTLPMLSEIYIDVTTNRLPSVTNVAPTGTVSTTMQPTVTATYSDADNDPLNAYEVKVFRATQYASAGFSPDTSIGIWESGIVTSTGGISQRVGTSLVNDTYRFYVRARQGGTFSQWSLWAYSTATISVTPPNAPTLTVEPEPTWARVRLVATDAGPAFVTGEVRSFEFERSTDGGSTWTAIARTADANVATYTYTTQNQAQTFHDYEAPRSALVYRARVHSVLPAGDVLTSAWRTSGEITLTRTGWWLKSTTDATYNIKINVHSPEFAIRSTERIGMFHALGRRNAIVLSDAIGGEAGDLQLAFLDQASFDAFERLRARREVLLLQSPYGDHIYVHLGADRGAAFMLNAGGIPKRVVTIPFIEVDPT